MVFTKHLGPEEMTKAILRYFTYVIIKVYMSVPAQEYKKYGSAHIWGYQETASLVICWTTHVFYIEFPLNRAGHRMEVIYRFSPIFKINISS